MSGGDGVGVCTTGPDGPVKWFPRQCELMLQLHACLDSMFATVDPEAERFIAIFPICQWKLSPTAGTGPFPRVRVPGPTPTRRVEIAIRCDVRPPRRRIP